MTGACGADRSPSPPTRAFYRALATLPATGASQPIREEAFALPPLRSLGDAAEYNARLTRQLAPSRPQEAARRVFFDAITRTALPYVPPAWPEHDPWLKIAGGQDGLHDWLVGQITALPPAASGHVVISIGGASGSGKTTFAERLAAALNDGGRRAAVIGTDGYLCTMAQMVAGCSVAEVADTAALEELLVSMHRRPEEPFAARRYSYGPQGHTLTQQALRGADLDVVIVEGLLAHATPRLHAQADLALTLAVPDAVRLSRCQARCPQEARIWTNVHSWLLANLGEYIAFSERVADVIVDVDGARLWRQRPARLTGRSVSERLLGSAPGASQAARAAP